MFYAGQSECQHAMWWFALFLLIIVFLSFIGVYYLLKTMPSHKRRYQFHALISLTDPFKENRWWWEFLLIARRISLAILGMFAYLDGPIIEFCMIVIIIISLWCQSWYSPFRDVFNDALEVFCLICLLAIISAVFSNELVSTNGPFISVIATIVM